MRLHANDLHVAAVEAFTLLREHTGVVPFFEELYEAAQAAGAAEAPVDSTQAPALSPEDAMRRDIAADTQRLRTFRHLFTKIKPGARGTAVVVWPRAPAGSPADPLVAAQAAMDAISRGEAATRNVARIHPFSHSCVAREAPMMEMIDTLFTERLLSAATMAQMAARAAGESCVLFGVTYKPRNCTDEGLEKHVLKERLETKMAAALKALPPPSEADPAWLPFILQSGYSSPHLCLMIEVVKRNACAGFIPDMRQRHDYRTMKAGDVSE
eukprot:gnl/Ergobibamus_cyprinoides/421.p2 GENE.gnl/Ergobibamus_cyprinoides/421~~gnl/Ergobibamus_cyprinoides/421.p2  ORF type:complete len:269 (+),score=51.38 gnl/Ergobibamus_cyprinoides/421:1095-1901(+)